MGTISNKVLKDEAMDLALLIYDIYTDIQISQVSGQIDANISDDNNN